jgi:hypothetical protein
MFTFKQHISNNKLAYQFLNLNSVLIESSHLSFTGPYMFSFHFETEDACSARKQRERKINFLVECYTSFVVDRSNWDLIAFRVTSYAVYFSWIHQSFL